jgi:CheY-like chemotaxis protein
VQGEALEVLLVEDNPDHEELIRRAFSDRGAAVALSVARHGEEALDFLFRRGEFQNPARSPRPRLILLDLRLPRIDGLDVLAEIKASAELRGIPAVVLTTSEAEPDVARAYELHANSYLVKPADFERLSNLLSTVESYWLDLNRLPQNRPGPASR